MKVSTTKEDPHILRVFGDIAAWEAWRDETTPAGVAMLLDSINPEDPIEVRINSYGGDAIQALAIYHMLKAHKGKVTALIEGVAASAATVVALAADDVLAYPGSLWLIHEASTWASGKAKDLQDAIDSVETINAIMTDLYAKKTGKDLEEIRALMAEDRFVTGEQAFEMGFIDGLIRDENKGQVAALATLSSLFSKKEENDLQEEEKANKTMPMEKKMTKEIETIEDLREAFPALVNGLEESFTNAGREIENQRIKEIEEIASGLDKETVFKAKFVDTFLSAKDVAFLAVKQQARLAKSHLEAVQEDGPQVEAEVKETAKAGPDLASYKEQAIRAAKRMGWQ